MRNLIPIVGLLLVAICIDAQDPKPNESIQSICQPTNYKEACVNSLNQAAPNTTDPKQLLQTAFQVAKKAVIDAIGKSATIQAAQTDPRSAQALEICREVMEYASNDLEKCVNQAGNFDTAADVNQFMEDLKVWLGGAVTYQDVCFDAFQNCTDLDAGLKLRNFFNASRQLTSNALTLMDGVKDFVSLLNIPGLFGTPGGPKRRLMADETGTDVKTATKPVPDAVAAGGTPAWMNEPARKILGVPLEQIQSTVVVAKDGSGQYKTIKEALEANPRPADRPYIIKIKAGKYEEYVKVDKTMTNVIFVGDGPDKTIISGHKSFVDGLPVYKTATLAVFGDGFMARDIAFENTAGPDKHQAVAAKIVGDYAVFVNCLFDGFQATLYPLRGRQFYRCCTIKGTLDIIMGDAQAVFQNCHIFFKNPLEEQECTILAQSRTEPAGPGVFVLHTCDINADPLFKANAQKQGSTAYLGRPAKLYSRAVVLQSMIDGCIEPEGWMEFSGTFGIDTSFFAEFGNRGPGADTKDRVKWKSYQTLTLDKAEEFTPESLYKGSRWVGPSGALYLPGLDKQLLPSTPSTPSV